LKDVAEIIFVVVVVVNDGGSEGVVAFHCQYHDKGHARPLYITIPNNFVLSILL
jgi:hypothetical protein